MEFLRRFGERLGELDMNALARDVEPFLFAPEQQRGTCLRIQGFLQILGKKRL